VEAHPRSDGNVSPSEARLPMLPIARSNSCLAISLPLPFPGVVLEKNVADHSLLYRAKAESQPPRSY